MSIHEGDTQPDEGAGSYVAGFLAAFAVAFAGICWFAGMVIAIALERPVF